METHSERIEAKGYDQDYVLNYLARNCRCSSLYPRNKVGTFEKKVLLIPRSMGIKRWGMVDYLCIHAGWSWKHETMELKELQSSLYHELQAALNHSHA